MNRCVPATKLRRARRLSRYCELRQAKLSSLRLRLEHGLQELSSCSAEERRIAAEAAAYSTALLTQGSLSGCALARAKLALELNFSRLTHALERSSRFNAQARDLRARIGLVDSVSTENRRRSRTANARQSSAQAQLLEAIDLAQED